VLRRHGSSFRCQSRPSGPARRSAEWPVYAAIGGPKVPRRRARPGRTLRSAFRPDGTRIWTLTRAWGDAAGRLAITAGGLLLDTEGGFVGPVRLGIIAEPG
jgi:hypothetical protein